MAVFFSLLYTLHCGNVNLWHGRLAQLEERLH